MEKEIVLKNDILQISLLESFIEQAGEELGLDSSLILNINLVLEEAVSNIIFYAYPKDVDENIYINVKAEDGVLICTIKDSGKYFDPTLIAEADITLPAKERSIGGLGIFLIKQIMNEVEYQRIEGNNIFTLKKIITN